MPVQERPRLFRPSTTIVVGVAVVVVWKIHRAGIAVAIVLTSGSGIAVAVAVTVTVTVTVTVISRAGIAIDHVVRIDDHDRVADACALRVVACVHVHVVQFILHTTLAIRDRKIIDRLAQLLVEFDSGIEQRARSATKEYGREKPGGHLNPLTLITIRPIIKDPVRVEEEVEIVKADDRLLLGDSAETILVDEQIEILCVAETSAENFPILNKSTTYIVYVFLFARIEVSIGLVEDMHSENPPVVLQTGSRLDPFVAIQRPFPEDLKIRHLCFLEEGFQVTPEFVAEPG
jgi:hypothetical protein